MANKEPHSEEEGLRDAEVRGAALGLRNHQKRRATAKRAEAFDMHAGRVLTGGVVVYLILAMTVGLIPAVIVICVLIFAAIIGRAIITDRSIVVAGVSWLATTLIITFAIGQIPQSFGDFGAAAIGYLLPIAAVFGPWYLRRHPGDRGLTAIIGHLGCLAATAISLWSVPTGAVFGVLWVTGVLALRGGGLISLRLLRARMRSHVAVDRSRRPRGPRQTDGKGLKDDAVEIGAEAEMRTAAALHTGLDDAWTILHSRELPHTRADVDHLAIGPSGVFLVDSKDWEGSITPKTVRNPGGEDVFEGWTMNGRMDRMIERLGPVMFEARQVAHGLSMNPTDIKIVVCFTDRMTLPEPVVTVEFRDIWDKRDEITWHPTVTLLHAESLVEHITSQPALSWGRRRWFTRLLDKRRGIDDNAADLRNDQQFVHDLGIAADYMFPPKP